MKGLTDKQRNILEFISDFMEANVMAPTVYEIAEHFNIKTSTVFAHLRSLQKKNYLKRSSKARSISLSKPRRKSRCPNGLRSVPLLDWVHEREINKGKKFYIQENRSSLVINIPGKWYDRMLLDTERDRIIPVLVEKYDMEYDDANQKKMMESPIGDSFGWSVSIKKRIECRSQSFDIKMTFNEWKRVDFYIYGQNVGQLVSRFKVPDEKIHKDYIQLSSVQYCMLKDMQNIDKKISHIIKVVQE